MRLLRLWFPSMTKKRKPLNEKVLRDMIVQTMNKNGWFLWANTVGMATVVGGRRLHFGAAGQADIIGTSNSGHFVAIECKVGAEPLRPEQLKWLYEVYGRLGIAVVVRAKRRTRTCFALAAEMVREKLVNAWMWRPCLENEIVSG